MEPEFELLFPDDLPEDYRSGFVALVGRPNVGKSTLLNRVLGHKVAIVSPKPQTTRNQLLGIRTTDRSQMVFVDTPGIHSPLHRLGESLVNAAVLAIPDADLIVWVVDVSVMPHADDRRVAQLLAAKAKGIPSLLCLNKADWLRPEDVQGHVTAYESLLPGAESLLTSAVRGDNIELLLERIERDLPLGPRYYPEDQVTDQQERFMVAELIREQVLLCLRDEVPHAVAVQVDEFVQRTANLTYISANIYVERDTQKVILLGKDGQMLKRIGSGARGGIEQLLEGRVFLDLWVKTRPKWRSKDTELRRLGYEPPAASTKGGKRRK